MSTIIIFANRASVFKILFHFSGSRGIQDPLRVLRGMQFAAATQSRLGRSTERLVGHFMPMVNREKLDQAKDSETTTPATAALHCRAHRSTGTGGLGSDSSTVRDRVRAGARSSPAGHERELGRARRCSHTHRSRHARSQASGHHQPSTS